MSSVTHWGYGMEVSTGTCFGGRRYLLILKMRWNIYPTWSWVATGGPKIICPIKVSGGPHGWGSSSTIAPPHNATKTLRITRANSIESRGYLTRPVRTLQLATDERFSQLFYADLVDSEVIPGGIIVPDSDLLNYYLILNYDNAERMSGIAVFDDGSPKTSAQCYVLAASERSNWKRDSLGKSVLI